MLDKSYILMDRIPGSTLNELTYRKPEILEDHKVTISYQLGMHMAFSFVFGVRDGFQTNYLFDQESRLLTRIDKESFFELPESGGKTLLENDEYTQEIAACELSNLKYIPSFRRRESRPQVLYAFRQGFLDKYSDIKKNIATLLELVDRTRHTWFEMNPKEDRRVYDGQTEVIREKVRDLIELDPLIVFTRIMKAKGEIGGGFSLE